MVGQWCAGLCFQGLFQQPRGEFFFVSFFFFRSLLYVFLRAFLFLFSILKGGHQKSQIERGSQREASHAIESSQSGEIQGRLVQRREVLLHRDGVLSVRSTLHPLEQSQGQRVAQAESNARLVQTDRRWHELFAFEQDYSS